jgi:hypothetical protein
MSAMIIFAWRAILKIVAGSSHPRMQGCDHLDLGRRQRMQGLELTSAAQALVEGSALA